MEITVLSISPAVLQPEIALGSLHTIFGVMYVYFPYNAASCPRKDGYSLWKFVCSCRRTRDMSDVLSR